MQHLLEKNFIKQKRKKEIFKLINDGITKKERICSFLMIGQSNMAGRGDFGEVEPIKNKKCFMLRMGRWQRMSEPINPDRAILETKFHSGIGLAASFADELSKYSGCEIGLIPCADGGTKIKQWQPGELLYDHAVAMAKLAMRTSDLCGIIWHQGESDCHQLNEEEYRKDFLNVMTSLRKDIGENLPIIIGEISDKITDNWKVDSVEKMNILLHKLQNELPMCAIVSVDGLELKPDGLHFNSKSCRELGKRYFEKYRDIFM